MYCRQDAICLIASYKILLFRCNRNDEKASIASSSGTISKTSDIGVGTDAHIDNCISHQSHEYLPTNNDTITVISSLSDHSVSMQESDKNLYECKGNFLRCKENNGCDVEVGCEIDTQIRRRYPNSSIEMQNEDGNSFHKTASPAKSSQANGSKEYSMHELEVFEGSSDRSSNGIKDGGTNVIPRILNITEKTTFEAETQSSRDNHTNTAFIYEENR